MNWRTVDMSRESRRDQFAYFQTLSNPYVGVTVQVDVTELMPLVEDLMKNGD